MALISKSDFTAKHSIISTRRDLVTTTETELTALEAELKVAQQDLARLEQAGLGTSTEALALRSSLASLETAVASKKTALAAAVEDQFQAVDDLFQLGGQSDLLHQLSDDFPILLLPIRLETRFMCIKHIYRRKELPGENYPRITDGWELWIRVFPDDLHVNTFEKLLTRDEREIGQQYWDNYAADPTEGGHLGAWRGLSSAFGPQRAAYIARVIQPPEYAAETKSFSDTPTWSHLDSVQLKDQAWTRAPRTQMLPDRFIFITEKNGTRSEYTGQLIPDSLQLSIDPAAEDDDSYIQENGSLKMPQELAWMTDFEKAEAVGMAMRIELSKAEVEAGFDRIMALGVMLSADEEESRERLERLIENHRYTDGGFALVPQGTPTNNTDAGASGYNQRELDADTIYRTERGDALFTAETVDSARKDGQWLADALGIDYEALGHVLHADGTDIAEGMLMNKALWPATMKYYLGTIMHPVFSPGEVAEVEAFFTKYVQGRGMVPSFRVGNQPYGVLPTTSFSKWAYASGDSGHSFHKGLFDGLLRGMDQTWGELSEKVKHVGADDITDLSDDFMEIIGLHASSVDFYQRFFLGSELLTNLKSFREELSGRTYNVRGNAVSEEEWRELRERYNFDLADDPFISQVLAMDDDRHINGPAVTEEPLSEKDPLPGIGDTPVNYIEWLTNSAHDFVKNEDFTTIGANPDQDAPKALLYMLLRHALLMEYANSAFSVLLENGKISQSAIAPKQFSNIAQIQLTQDDIGQLEQQVRMDFGLPIDPNLNGPLMDPFGPSGPSGPSTPTGPFLFPPGPLAPPPAPGPGPGGDDPQLQMVNMELNLRIADIEGTAPKFNRLDLSVAEVTEGKPFAQFLDDAVQLNTLPGQSLRKLRTVLGKLQHLPTARLERAFAEHVDLCSHRLDAWLLGLVNERLFSRRFAASERQKGCYLGAFGWVENLKKGSFDAVSVREIFRKSGKPIFSFNPADFEVGEQLKYTTGDKIVYVGYDNAVRVLLDADAGLYRAEVRTDDSNQGFVHTPSLGHAVTAAILRAGYLANFNPDDPEGSLAVNLDSRRVRKAMYYLEGLQNGQSLGAMLGYHFERVLHENEDDLELDTYIYALREKYPLVAGSVLDHGSTDSIETVEANHVVDGLQLVEAYRKAMDDGAPWVADISFATSAEKAAVLAAAENLLDHLDALGDLTLAETVFQMARGNHERAKAMLNAISGANAAFPMPQIQETPRTGDVLTHKVFVQFDPTATPNQWTSKGTPRSVASPGLNKWLADMLGPGSKIIVRGRATYLDEDGKEVSVEKLTSLAALALEPIDLIYLVGANSEDLRGGEMGRLVRYLTLQRARQVDARVEWLIEATHGLNSEQVPFARLLPLIETLAELVRESRPLQADDFRQSGSDTADTGGIDMAAFRTHMKTHLMHSKVYPYQLYRVQYYMKRYADYLRTRENWAAFIVPVTRRLMEAFRIGATNSIPYKNYEATEENRQELLAQADAVYLEVKARFDEATELWNDAAGKSDTQQLQAYQKMAELLYGPGFKLLPGFQLHNPDEITQAHTYAETGNLLSEGGDFPVDEWIQGIATVRDRMRCYQRMEILRDTHQEAEGAGTLQPVQLPHQTDAKWLGIEFPADYEVPGDTLSLVGQFQPGFDASLEHTGLLIDEWTEVIPRREETSGIALHYDQPDAQAPQSVLLVVTPEETGNWAWEDLVDAVSETLDLAKKRAVDPDLLAESDYPQVLPMLWFALSGEEGLTTLDLSNNMSPTVEGVFNGELQMQAIPEDYYTLNL